jgi:uncharacterized membrane protein YfcA
VAADGTLTASLVTLLPLALGAFVLAGFLQSVSGFGAALVAVPLLALVLGPVPAVVAVTTARALPAPLPRHPPDGAVPGDRVFHRVPPAAFHRVVAAALLASALLLLLDGAHALS